MTGLEKYSERTFQTDDIVYGLENMQRFNPNSTPELYRFAEFLGQRFKGQELKPWEIAYDSFSYSREMLAGCSPTLADYDLPTELLKLSHEKYVDFFFETLDFLFSITQGELERGIMQEFERIRMSGSERLDALDKDRKRFRAARSGAEYSLKELEWRWELTDYPAQIRHDYTPPYAYPSWICGDDLLRSVRHISQGARYFIPDREIREYFPPGLSFVKPKPLSFQQKPSTNKMRRRKSSQN